MQHRRVVITQSKTLPYNCYTAACLKRNETVAQSKSTNYSPIYLTRLLVKSIGGFWRWGRKDRGVGYREFGSWGVCGWVECREEMLDG